MDGFALGVEGGAVEDFVEGLLGLADNLYAALLGVPAFTHHVDVHDAAWARDLEFLMLVHAGLHLDGVGFLRAVAVLGGGAFQYGSRQITLVIFSACPKHVRQQNVIAVSRIVTVFI